MKRIYCLNTILIFLFIFTIGANVITAKTLYDDFQGSSIDRQRWNRSELVRMVINGELVTTVKHSPNISEDKNYTGFQNASTINTIQSDVTINETTMGSGISKCYARVTGHFYKSQISDKNLGLIIAYVDLEDRGNGLEARWKVMEVKDEDKTIYETLAGNYFDTLQLDYGQPYTLKIEYDGNTGFTFTVAGVSETYTGPARLQGPEYDPWKGLHTGIQSDGGSGDGYISASYDNVYINNQLLDTFDTGLDSTKWRQNEEGIEVKDGKLLLTSHSIGERANARMGFAEIHPYTEATITIKSNSQLESGDRGIARIDGYFYNDTYGPGNYNGYEGNVWAGCYLNYESDGTLKAVCSADKTLDAAETSWETLFYKEFNVPVIFDRAYKFLIYLDGIWLRFSCQDTVTGREDIGGYEITTSVYEPYDEFRSLLSRVYGNAAGGYMAAEFDNVYVDVAEPPAIYDANGYWAIAGSDEWSTCGELPTVEDDIIQITQDGKDITLVVPEDEGEMTLNGIVFGDTYRFLRDVTVEGNREVMYGVFHLSQNTSGTGSVTMHFWESDVHQCAMGFNIAITKEADTDGDGIPDASDDDDDNDGVLDVNDDFPLDNSETTDTDDDGTGDNADTDDDNDGISDVTETAGPNSGDANNDGTLDSLQNNVASVEDFNAQGYVVLETPTGTVLSSCQAADSPSPGDAPANVNFDYGFFGFTISGIAAGGSTTLTMTLPDGVIVNTYYRHGKTPDNQVDHWYEFLYDGETGVEINGNVITFHFVDALRGDDILIQDSMVIDLGGPGFTVPEGGGGGGCFISAMNQ